MRKFYFLTFSLLFGIKNLTAQVTYLWTGGATGDYQLASNWAPARTTPALNDILQFNSGSSIVVTNVPTQTVGAIKIIAGTSSVSLGANTSSTLTLGAAIPLIYNSAGSILAADFLTINLSSAANFAISSGTLGIAPGTGGKINVAGAVSLTSPGVLDFDVAGTGGTTITGSITYNSGTFNCVNAPSIIWTSGSNYYHAASGSAASAIPVATWQSGSTCNITGLNTSVANIPTGFTSATFANLTWNCISQFGNVVLFPAAGTLTLTGTFTMNSTGPNKLILSSASSAINVGLYTQNNGTVALQSGAGTTTLSVAGNFTMNNGTLNSLESGATGTAIFDLKKDITKTGGTWQSPSTSTTAQTIVQFSGSVGQTLTASGSVWSAPSGGTWSVVNNNSNVVTGVNLAGCVLRVYNNNSSTAATLTMNGIFTGSGGATILYAGAGTGGTTLIYNAAFLQTASGFEFPSSNGPLNLTINNSLGVLFPSSFSRTVPGTLTMLNGNFAIGSGNTLSLTNTTLASQLTYTAGFLTTGTLSRYFPAAGLPTSVLTAGRFPFGTGVNNRSLYVYFSASTAATAGMIDVTHTPLVGITAMSLVDDASATNLDKRTNTSWTINAPSFVLGSTTASLSVVGENIGSVDDFNFLRLTDGSTNNWVTTVASSGSNTVPVVGKSNLSQTDLTSKTLYYSSTVINPLIIITFTWTGASGVDGDWTRPGNWTGAVGYPSAPTEIAIINSTVNFQPFIKPTDNINVYQLTVTNPMTLTLQGSAIISVFDNLSFTGTDLFNSTSTFGYASSNAAQSILDLSYGNLTITGTAPKSLLAKTRVRGNYSLSGSVPVNTGNEFIYEGAGAQRITASTYNDLTITGNRGGNVIALGNSVTSNTIDVKGVFKVSGVSNYTVNPAFNTFKFSGASQTIPGFYYQAIDNGPGDRVFDNQGTFNAQNVIYCRSLARNTGNYTVTNSKVNFYVSGSGNANSYTGSTYYDLVFSGNLNNFEFDILQTSYDIAGSFIFAITNYKQGPNNKFTFNFSGTGNQIIPAFKTNVATNTPAFKYSNVTIAGGSRKVTFAGSNTDTIGIKGNLSVSSAFTGAGNGIITDSSTVSFSVGSGTVPVLTAANSSLNNYNNLHVAGGTRAFAGNMTIGGNLSVSGVADTTIAILNIGDGNTSRTVNVLGNMVVNGGGSGTVATGQIDMNTGTLGRTTLNLAKNLVISGNGQLMGTTSAVAGSANGVVLFNGTAPQTYSNTSAFKNGLVNFTVGNGTLPSKLTLLTSLDLLASATAVNKGTLAITSKSTLDAGTNNITSNGTGNAIFNLNADAELITANTGGVEGTATSSSTGTILNDVTKMVSTYNALASYTLNAAANAGTSFPASPATFPMANLTFGNNINPATFTLNKPIAISNALTLKSRAIFELSASDVTLTSTATNTAKVTEVPSNANITYSAAGRVNVERYYPARRAWRLVTAPLSATGTVFSTWQNGGIYASGIGTYVTGNPVANGLDASPENNSSLKEGSALTPVLSPNTTLLSTSTGNGDNKPFFLFVRGDRTSSNFYIPNSNNTTLSSRGKLQLFNHSFAASSLANGLAMIGNPYASPVDFFKATRNNLLNKFYVWDPKLGSQGGYITFDDTDNNDGVYTQSVPSPSGLSNILQSSQAFIVETASAGAASLVFSENNKSVTNNLNAFRPSRQQKSFRALLHQLESDSSTILTDGFLVEFDDIYTKNVTSLDAAKVTNVNEMLGVLKGTSNLALARMPDFSENDTLYISFKKTKQRNYRLEFLPINLSGTLSAFIDDNYTGRQTALNVSGSTTYDFTVNAEAKSAAANRFKIIFKTTVFNTLPVTFKNIKAFQQGGGISVDWTVENEINISNYTVEKSTDGTKFSTMSSFNAKNTGGITTTYQITDPSPANGTNFYRIAYYNKDGSFEYSRVVMVNIGKGASGISIYPNPVTGNNVGVALTNLEKGIYSVRLINTNGQILLNKQLNHAAGSSIETLTPNSKLVTGVYQMEVIDPSNKVTALKVLVQ